MPYRASWKRDSSDLSPGERMYGESYTGDHTNQEWEYLCSQHCEKDLTRRILSWLMSCYILTLCVLRSLVPHRSGPSTCTWETSPSMSEHPPIHFRHIILHISQRYAYSELTFELLLILISLYSLTMSCTISMSGSLVYPRPWIC